MFPKIQSTLAYVLDRKKSEADLRLFPLNDRVIEMAMTWRKLQIKLAHLLPVIRFHVYYATLAPQSRVDKYMRTKNQQLQKWLNGQIPENGTAEVEYKGDTKLYALLGMSTDFTATLTLAKPPIRETPPSSRSQSLVGLVSIKDYLKFLRQDKSKVLRDEMFAVNVRDYAGSNIAVNTAIGKTLTTDSKSLFWWLNNGITIIADEAGNPLELEWVLTNPLIVNGLQTSHVIHEQDCTGTITRKRLSQCLLVRIIIAADSEVREAIISGTNNQTAIASQQLHANDETQKRIEQYLHANGWYYERRSHQYRGMKVPASRIKNMQEVGQAVIAYRLLEPDTARARPTKLLGNDKGWKTVFPVEDEDRYLKAISVVDTVDDYLRTAEAKNISDDPNSRYYLVAGYALRSSGAKTLEAFRDIPSSALKSHPSFQELTDLHKELYKQVAELDDKTSSLDRIFKGPLLKGRFFDRIIKLNASDSRS